MPEKQYFAGFVRLYQTPGMALQSAADQWVEGVEVVELTGFEPVTYTLRTYRSSQTELQPH